LPAPCHYKEQGINKFIEALSVVIVVAAALMLLASPGDSFRGCAVALAVTECPGGGAPRHGHITGAPVVAPIMVRRTVQVTPITIVHTMWFIGPG